MATASVFPVLNLAVSLHVLQNEVDTGMNTIISPVAMAESAGSHSSHEEDGKLEAQN